MWKVGLVYDRDEFHFDWGGGGWKIWLGSKWEIKSLELKNFGFDVDVLS